MSVFVVQLNNQGQGLLDRQPTANPLHAGGQFTVSKQRQVYVMGPKRINRLLSDGETFTDCNYWKRFAYPQVPLDEAIIRVVTDDGSVYSDIPGENTYPKVYNLSCDAASGYTDNQADILGDTSGYATFAQITNTHATQDVKVRLNGSADAIIDLPANSTQVFNTGDLAISKIEVANNESGAAGPVVVQILVSVKSVCVS